MFTVASLDVDFFLHMHFVFIKIKLYFLHLCNIISILCYNALTYGCSEAVELGNLDLKGPMLDFFGVPVKANDLLNRVSCFIISQTFELVERLWVESKAFVFRVSCFL